MQSIFMTILLYEWWSARVVGYFPFFCNQCLSILCPASRSCPSQQPWWEDSESCPCCNSNSGINGLQALLRQTFVGMTIQINLSMKLGDRRSCRPVLSTKNMELCRKIVCIKQYIFGQVWKSPELGVQQRKARVTVTLLVMKEMFVSATGLSTGLDPHWGNLFLPVVGFV